MPRSAIASGIEGLVLPVHVDLVPQTAHLPGPRRSEPGLPHLPLLTAAARLSVSRLVRHHRYSYAVPHARPRGPHLSGAGACARAAANPPRAHAPARCRARPGTVRPA